MKLSDKFLKLQVKQKKKIFYITFLQYSLYSRIDKILGYHNLGQILSG